MECDTGRWLYTTYKNVKLGPTYDSVHEHEDSAHLDRAACVEMGVPCQTSSCCSKNSTSALMNYAVQDHLPCFGGCGLLGCTPCGGKHCMSYQRLESSSSDGCRFPQRRAAACGHFQLMLMALSAWGHLHKQGSCGGVMSGELEETAD